MKCKIKLVHIIILVHKNHLNLNVRTLFYLYFHLIICNFNGLNNFLLTLYLISLVF